MLQCVCFREQKVNLSKIFDSLEDIAVSDTLHLLNFTFLTFRYDDGTITDDFVLQSGEHTLVSIHEPHEHRFHEL